MLKASGAFQLETSRKAAAEADRQNLVSTERHKLDAANAQKAAEREQEVILANNQAALASDREIALKKVLEEEPARGQKLVRFEAVLPEICRLLAPFITPGKK